MKIRRIIIYNKSRCNYKRLLEEVKIHIKKNPMFIGTPRQWNRFIEESKGDKSS